MLVIKLQGAGGVLIAAGCRLKPLIDMRMQCRAMSCIDVDKPEFVLSGEIA